MVAVAQSVEHRIVIPVVVGSIPISHPNFLQILIDKRIPQSSVIAGYPVSFYQRNYFQYRFAKAQCALAL